MPTLDQQIEDVPTVWFFRLERAVRNGDRDEERAARAGLVRLGVTVTVSRGARDRWATGDERARR